MSLQDVIRSLPLVARRPRLLSVAASNLAGRLTHPAVVRFSGGRSPRPEQLTILVTDICNFRCRMCHFAHSDASAYSLNRIGHMPPDTFRRLLDGIPGGPLVSFTGGEPLLHPRIADYVAYAHAKGCPTTLTTNGWHLAGHARTLTEAGLDLLVVSVDGPRQLHDRIRAKGAFDRLRAGLAAILQIPNRPVVFISVAISDVNSHQLLAMYELARQWDVDGINYNHLWIQGDDAVSVVNSEADAPFLADEVSWDVQPDCVGVDRVSTSLSLLRRTRSSNPLVVSETPFLRSSEVDAWYRKPTEFVKWRTTRCPWIRMRVWPDGSVRPCRGWVVGNVNETPPMEIWNSPQFRGFRRLIRARGAIPICARCCYLAHR